MTALPPLVEATACWPHATAHHRTPFKAPDPRKPANLRPNLVCGPHNESWAINTGRDFKKGVKAMIDAALHSPNKGSCVTNAPTMKGGAELYER